MVSCWILLLVDCKSGSVSNPLPTDGLPLAEEYMCWDLPADSDWDNITVVSNKTISKDLSSPALPPEDNGSFSVDASTAHTPVKEEPLSNKVNKRHRSGQDLDLTQMRTVWSGKVGGVADLAPRMIPNNTPPDDFVELSNPPRLAPLLKVRGFRSEVRVDLLTGYDITNDSIKREVNLLLEQRRPRVVFMSASCTVFSRLMSINIGRMDPGKW